MNQYLVEYKMTQYGKVIKNGIETVFAYSENDAEKSVFSALGMLSRNAEISIIETVQM